MKNNQIGTKNGAYTVEEERRVYLREIEKAKVLISFINSERQRLDDALSVLQEELSLFQKQFEELG